MLSRREAPKIWSSQSRETNESCAEEDVQVTDLDLDQGRCKSGSRLEAQNESQNEEVPQGEADLKSEAVQNAEDQKENKNRKQGKKLLEDCVNISSGDKAIGKDTPKVVLAKKVGRDIMMAEAKAQLDRLDVMVPLMPE